MKTTFLLWSIYFFCTIFFMAPVHAEQDASPPLTATEHVNTTIESATLKGQRLILFLYTIDDSRAEEAAELMQELYIQRRQYNFELTGIALNTEAPNQINAFNAARGLTFPVIIDDGTLAQRFKLTSTAGFVLFNEKGRQIVRRQASHTPPHMNLKQQWRTYLSSQLNILAIPDDQPVLGLNPPAPLFEAETINGQKISIAKLYKNKPLRRKIAH